MRFIPIHQIVRTFWPDQSLDFLFFHAFSGCDTTSSLSGKDRKSFFDTCTSTDDISSIFKKLSAIATPDEISDDEFKLLEFFVVKLYSETYNTKEVNESRMILFSRG